MEISKKIKIDISGAQTFNDTDHDGYGEFEGWGTSLCWWANRLGYSAALTEQSAKAFFDPVSGLGMNIGRYNIGGGDNVTDPEAPFYHAPHIKRSDSEVPGYCSDVVKIDLTANSREYYEENYARADFECGYAWNYDWDADTNQMNILKAAIKAAGDAFIAEAFSNSPPYFMTVSGCSSGGEDPGIDNLREDSCTAFACYLADVIEHWKNEGLIFQSAAPMNEPATSYWKANSDKQEGCHFSMGESQSKILAALNKELTNKGIDIIISASDETSIDTAAASFEKLTDEAKAVVGRIDTHAYQGTQRSLLKAAAEKAGKNLWMSEVDGTEGLFSAGRSESGMQAALGFARAIITDLNGMKPTAWIMWDAVDIHVDSKNEFDTCARSAADGIIAGGTPFWGIGIADHDKKELLLGQKYYAFGQFTR
ncbi:MAG: xylosidase/arabinofuranosidase, partial [Lachnospiraceae bacterium]|nr:xylosidase/arabinofuranosidase [Lachnospiraceae bacterium]